MSAGNHDLDPDPDHPWPQPEPQPGSAGTGTGAHPGRWRADCENCFALCCVALWLSASADFAITKPAGTPCRNLQADNRCSIHTRLRTSGFGGCATYDCFGAGQQVSQVTFGGRDWRTDPQVAGQMFDVFPIMRTLHELCWYLTWALAMPAVAPLRDRLLAALESTEQMTAAGPGTLQSLDVSAHRDMVNDLLRQASDLARAAVPGRRKDHRGADLIGARLAGADLRGASLRGALLMGADLRAADLGCADVTGANFSGANLAGADLSTSLFLHQSQLDAATGDPRTKLPRTLTRPAHWPATADQGATTATATAGSGRGGRGRVSAMGNSPSNRPQRRR